MKINLIEKKLLQIRQDLRDQLKQVKSLEPINMVTWAKIRDDYQYCNFLLKICRSKRQVKKQANKEYLCLRPQFSH
jgi:heterodisulfide reductase subunit A-like polyferredoxin